MTGKEMRKEMERFINNFNDTEKYIFIDEMTNIHRTLQQDFTKLIFNYVLKQAEKYESGNYDLRNEAAILTCKKVADFLKKNDIAINGKCHFPCI